MSIQGINLNNDMFNMFVDFARGAGSDTAIAKLGEGLGGRTVTAARNGDFVGNIWRGRSKMDANLAVRTKFLDTIAEMFGSIDKAPSTVKEALKLDDFEIDVADKDKKCRPLTARRILAINTAVQDYAAAIRNVAAAASRLHVQLDSDKSLAASKLLVKYCGNMPLKNVELLANFVVSLPLTRGDQDEALVEEMSNSIRKWRDFEPGDKSMKGLTDLYKDEYNMDMLIRVKTPKAGDYIDSEMSIYKTFADDIPRAGYKIGANDYPFDVNDQESKTQVGQKRPQKVNNVVAAFKAAVGNPAHQRAISAIFNQCIGSACYATSFGQPLNLTKKTAYTKACYGKMANVGVKSDRLFPGAFLGTMKSARYNIQVSSDGKSVTLGATLGGCGLNVSDMGDPNSFQRQFAEVDLKFVLTIDLSKEAPEIKDFGFGQTLRTEISQPNTF